MIEYTPKIWFILIGMVITGAGRSVAVKLFYQLGFESALFVTILYLLGQSFALIVHYLTLCIKEQNSINKKTESEKLDKVADPAGQSLEKKVTSFLPDVDLLEVGEVQQTHQMNTKQLQKDDYRTITIENSGSGENPSCVPVGDYSEHYKSVQKKAYKQTKTNQNEKDDINKADNNMHSSDKTESTLLQDYNQAKFHRARLIPGSGHGLTLDSHEATKLIHHIPFALKPMIPGFFNLCNSVMRWASLIYVPASVAEMLISGLELVLSVVAQRIIRKRLVSKWRWIGVGIITIGVIISGLTDSSEPSREDDSASGSSEKTSNNEQQGHYIGILLIVGQSIMSVFQDLAEELFMQETDFPPTLLLGYEGLFGLMFALVLYFPLAPVFGEDPSDTISTLFNSSFKTVYAVCLTILFTITGILNIWATAVTSSMTRNVWKNLRTACVWLLGLLTYYCSNGTDVGEPWSIPASFILLFGFLTMLTGMKIYYSKSTSESSTETSSDEDDS